MAYWKAQGMRGKLGVGFCPTCNEPNGEPPADIAQKFMASMEFDEIDPALCEGLEAPTCEDLQLLAAKYADVVILGEENTGHVEAFCKENDILCIDGKNYANDPAEAIKVYESLLVEEDVE